MKSGFAWSPKMMKYHAQETLSTGNSKRDSTPGTACWGTRYVAGRIVFAVILAVQPGGGSNFEACFGCFPPFIMSRLRQYSPENPAAMTWPLKRAISHFTTLACGVMKCMGMQGDDGQHEKRNRVFISRVEPGHQMRVGMFLRPYIDLPLGKTSICMKQVPHQYEITDIRICVLGLNVSCTTAHFCTESLWSTQDQQILENSL